MTVSRKQITFYGLIIILALSSCVLYTNTFTYTSIFLDEYGKEFGYEFEVTFESNDSNNVKLNEIVKPWLNSTVRTMGASVTLDEFISKRDSIEAEILAKSLVKIKEAGVNLKEVKILNLILLNKMKESVIAKYGKLDRIKYTENMDAYSSFSSEEKLSPSQILQILEQIEDNEKTDSIELNQLDNNGLKIGLWKEVIIEGKDSVLVYCNYETGIKNGIFQAYYWSGEVLLTSEYINDRITGTHQTFHKNGQLHYEIMYSMGKMNGSFKRYYESGAPNEFKYYENDSIIWWKWFYETGNMRMHVYKDTIDPNTRHYAEYYENGVLERTWLRMNGQLEGEVLYFSPEGIITKRTVYRNNEIIE